MAQTAISILLTKRISQSFRSPNRAAIFLLLHHSKNLTLKPYSSSASPDPPPPASSSSLSARMSFIFDQIDAIERERSQKDETLQRIRAWRQSKNAAEQQRQNVDAESLGSQNEGFGAEDFGDSPVNLAAGNSVEVKGKNEVELVHPWPEWIDLMQRLVQQNYFDHRRVNEDKLVENLGMDGLETVVNSSDVGIDFKDYKTVQTACVNFGKDRFDIFRKLSRKDIQILVGYGCPSADKKVVFSSKLLRKHAHLDEGDVCSNCSLRSSCERAYLVTNKEDEARTIDVMRVLLTYGFDPINETVTNKTLPKQKTLKTIVRKLLHEIVKLSAVPRDPNLPPPVIKRPPPKVKQPPPTPKRRVGRDDVDMKKGDWVCRKCDFMNFAKNTVCLQCDAKRPKRQLLPGEWECPQCNFLNYRRNMACFHCDCKRPPEEFNESQMEQRQPVHKTRFEKITDRSEVSNAWNFDFDDNESDGADVAAFEYADPARTDNDPRGPAAEGVNFRGPDDFNQASRNPTAHGTGFDDFADEDDDLDSYELDTGNNRSSFSSNSSRQDISEWEDGGNYNDDFRANSRNPKPYSKPFRSKHKSASFSGSDDDELGLDSDDEYNKRPNWKSSHVADSGSRNKGRGQTGRSRGLSFGSDEDMDLDSDAEDDDFGSSRRRGNKRDSGRRNNRRNSDFEDDSFSGFGSEDDEVSSRGNRFGRKKMEGGGRRNGFRDRGDYDSGRNARGRSKGKIGNRNNSWNDEFEPRSSSRSRDSGRRFQGNDRGMNDRGGKSGNFRGGKRGFEDRRQPRSRDYQDADPSEFRNSRRVIER